MKHYTVELDINLPAVWQNIEARNKTEAEEKAIEMLQQDLHNMSVTDIIEEYFCSDPKITENYKAH